jgi:hypothetical protein
MILIVYQILFMRKIVSVLCTIIVLLWACSGSDKEKNLLEAHIQTLQQRLDSTYKPGLGEFMTAIQIHHAKLWFAGRYENWKLADFEINEIKETLDDINRYCKDRPEIKSLPMIFPAFDSVSSSIKNQNGKSFKLSFTNLTNACNNCHTITNHGFNAIQIPEKPPFSNQDFRNPNP